MEFRPCIDIHNGKVRQIVGSSLRDCGDLATVNFTSDQDARFYALLYKRMGIKGGHVILLNHKDSGYYEATRRQALSALSAYPGGLQAGGGINDSNAEEYLDAGASHVIVTSYVFRNGQVDYEALKRMTQTVGAKRLVLDLSCRRRGEDYYIVTDRWQNFTEVRLCEETLDLFSEYCDEFLVHAVDAEGKAGGVETQLLGLLGDWGKKSITYAGGVRGFEDLELIKKLGKDRIHATVGSALDIFGGSMSIEAVLDYCRECASCRKLFV